MNRDELRKMITTVADEEILKALWELYELKFEQTGDVNHLMEKFVFNPKKDNTNNLQWDVKTVPLVSS